MSDLAVIPVAGQLGDYSDPTMFVELALTRAKEWLIEAVEHGQIDQIVELKSQAEAIRAYTVQKQLGKDAELNAAEIVRRAERGLGLAIRKGQAEGTITSRIGNLRNQGRNPEGDVLAFVASPYDFATKGELSGTGDQPGAYDLADNVTDTQFEDAITVAREEQNLSRANVARKVKGEAKPKPADRSDWHYGTQRINPERVVEEVVGMLEGIASSLALIHEAVPALDADKRLAWSEALREPLAVINRFKKELKA